MTIPHFVNDCTIYSFQSYCTVVSSYYDNDTVLALPTSDDSDDKDDESETISQL